MNYTGNAIKEAVEKGGYDQFMQLREPFLDPAFWQALGKARGWAKGKWCNDSECGEEGEHYHQVSERNWLYKWHSFIDHLATGADAETFFKSLYEK